MKINLLRIFWLIIGATIMFLYLSPHFRIIPKHIGKGISPEFEMCVKSFQIMTKNYNHVPIQFNYLEKGLLGVAYPIFGYPEIEINEVYWDNLGDRQCFLIWHEMAHALYKIGHDDREFDDGCAKSIMNAYLPENICIYRHLNEYMIDFLEQIK